MKPKSLFELTVEHEHGVVRHNALEALREVLATAQASPFAPLAGQWRRLVASLAFHEACDVSFIRTLGMQDQARFETITRAFMSGMITPGDVRSLYLEHFQNPPGKSERGRA